METRKFKIEIAGRELSIEFRDLAEQANGSAFVRYGDTVVLATAVMAKEKREDIDFFPLTVDYEERYYAAGKIRGPRYIKRESRPSDEAIVTARLVDRTIRPRFPKELNQEVQVVLTCLSWDAENDPAIVGVIAASVSLLVSDIPWRGPVAAIRVGRINDQFVLNPTYEMREKSKINLIFGVGSVGEDILLNMIDGDCEEIGEEMIIDAFKFVKSELKKLCEFQKQIAKNIRKEKCVIESPPVDKVLEKELKEFLGNQLENALFEKDKSERLEKITNLKEKLFSFVEQKYPSAMEKIRFSKTFWENEIECLVHKNIIEKGKRPDGRGLDELREIYMEVGVLPRTHGSGLFCRGETKALSILTLGAPGDQQILEGMEIVGKKRFMHHYNFPPYSTGEVKPMRGPARRDIGHGMLAEKALLPLIPSFEEFPYTIRVVSEILSSNGSTSMAAVTASSLALMDAGVPLKAPATGISLGLMTDSKGNYKILTDIQGPEDRFGDMDFKVAGTKQGITAIQMDVKIDGITTEVLEGVLSQGKKVRYQILNKMEKVLAKPRPQLYPFAPRILTIKINPDKIREVVGPGGKVINEIIGDTGVAIDIEDSGLIFVTSEKEESARRAIAWIENITREIKVGEVFQGKIKRILNFGAFAEILPGQEGLIHISQLAPYRIRRVEDVVKVGDIVSVRVISIDEQGRINLSLKAATEQGQ